MMRKMTHERDLGYKSIERSWVGTLYHSLGGSLGDDEF